MFSALLQDLPEVAEAAAAAEGLALEAPPATPAAALTGLVMIAASLAAWPLCAFLVSKLVPERRVFFARWGFSHVGLMVLAFFAATVLVSPLSRALVGAGYGEVFAGLCGMMLVLGIVAAYVVWLAQGLDPDGAASLGLRAEGSARAAGAGLLCYAMMLPGYFGLVLAWPWAMGVLELEFAPQEVAVGMLELTRMELLVAIPLAVLVQPFLEELVFRGFLQPLFVQNLGDRGGVVVTSALFGLMHGASASLPIFGLSLILGGVMLRTQRLFAPFLVHAVHNGLMLLLLFGAERAAGA